MYLTHSSSDLWALGCIIYQMIAGRPPFRAISEFLIFQKVSKGEFQYPKGFPDVAKDLINKLLVRCSSLSHEAGKVLDPDKRLGISEGGYKELKEHPFFKDINFDTLSRQTPPTIKPYPQKLIFEEDTAINEQSLRRKMQEEESERWCDAGCYVSNTLRKKFLQPDEIILESGLVWKRKGRSVKKRELLLTNKPRIIYIDPKKMVLKGEVPWSSNLKPEAKNNVAWFIHTVSIHSCTDLWNSQNGPTFWRTSEAMLNVG